MVVSFLSGDDDDDFLPVNKKSIRSEKPLAIEKTAKKWVVHVGVGYSPDPPFIMMDGII